MTVKISQEVYDGIEAVRKSGLTNMFDSKAVIELCQMLGNDVAAKWVEENKDAYSRLVFEGSEIIKD